MILAVESLNLRIVLTEKEEFYIQAHTKHYRLRKTAGFSIEMLLSRPMLQLASYPHKLIADR